MTNLDHGSQFTNEKYFFQYGREEQQGSLQTPSLTYKNKDSSAAIIRNLVSFF